MRTSFAMGESIEIRRVARWRDLELPCATHSDRRPRHDQAQDASLRHAVAARGRARPIPRPARARRRSTRPRRSCFPDSDHAAALFNMERAGHVYSRISNPTVRGARGAHRGARRRRRRDRHRQRAGGAAPRDRHAAGRGHAHRRVARRCTAARTTCSTTRCRASASTTTFVDPRDLDAWRARHPSGDAAPVRRDARQSRARRARHPARRRRSRTSTACRCSSIRRSRRRISCGRSSTAPTSSSTPRRSSCRATASSSAACWSTAGRSTGMRGGRARQVSDADRAVSRLSRHGVRRGVDDRRVPAARAARGRARLRRVHGAVHRVPDPAGRRDAAAAHGEARRQRAQGRRVPARASARRRRWAIRSCPTIPITRSRSGCCRAAAAPCSASRSRARARRGASSSRRSTCSRISPTSATRSRW